MKHDLEKLGQAIGLISNWLREVAPSTISMPADPQNDRNHAIRELTIAFLEYQFRRAQHKQHGLPPGFASLDSTRVIHLLEAAADTHQKFTSFE